MEIRAALDHWRRICPFSTGRDASIESILFLLDMRASQREPVTAIDDLGTPTAQFTSTATPRTRDFAII